MLKSCSLLRWINQSLELKIFGILLVVFLILVPAGSWFSYQHAYKNAHNSAETKVHELMAVIQENAAIAAYLNDNQLAHEIVDGLVTVPEIFGVEFTLSSGETLKKGVASDSAQIIHIVLSTQFSAQPVGSLDIFINSDYINQQATSKGIELVGWELVFIISILLILAISYRILIYHPLNELVGQIRNIQFGEASSQQKISVSSVDEIGFLAHNMNIMIEKIHDSYAVDREKSRRIAELEKQFRLIFDNSFAGIALLTNENTIFLANTAFTALFTDNHQAILNENQSIAQAFIDDKQVEHVLDLVRSEKKNVFRDFELKGSEDIWLRALFSLIEIEDERHEKYVEMVVYDISDRAKKEKHFAYNASHDPLTGLLNRRGAELSFAAQIDSAKQQHNEFVLILIDLNKFKPVNDDYGHEAGDIVLKEISSRLRSVMTSNDVVVRWGGDEFIISMTLTSQDDLETKLSDIQQVFEPQIEISSDIHVQVGASLGVSTASACGYDICTLIDQADSLMYQVKKERKGGYRITSSEDSPMEGEKN